MESCDGLVEINKAVGIDPQAAGEKPAKAGGDERLDDAGHGPSLMRCVCRGPVS